MGMAGKGYYQSSVDAVVHQGPLVLYCVILLTSVTGGDITVYDGLDATSGRKVVRIEGQADVSNAVELGGVILSRGLMVDVGSNVTEYTIIWRALAAQ